MLVDGERKLEAEVRPLQVAEEVDFHKYSGVIQRSLWSGVWTFRSARILPEGGSI